jgi:RNA polymerase primary sigma factor
VQQNGCEPTLEETASLTGLSLKRTSCLLQMSRHSLSLDQPMDERDDGHFSEFLQDNRIADPLYQMDQALLRARIAELLKALSFREREIIRLRYGLADGCVYTLEEVGKIFSVTRERIRQIEAKAVRKLQHPVRSRMLLGFLDSPPMVGASPTS